MLKQIANWFRRKKLESGLDRELSYHVERRTADLEKTGLSSADARRRALSEVGGVPQVQDQVLLHALPVREPGRLVLIDWDGDEVSNGFGSWDLMSYPICRDLDKQKEFFTGVFCRAFTRVNLSSGGSDYQPATAEIVSGNYFVVLGVGPTL